LKPLSVSDNKQTDAKASTSDDKSDGSKKKYIDKDTNQEFEHVPAENIGEKKELKTFKDKLEEQREKRKLLDKLSKTKSIGNDLDEEDVDSAQAWLKKLKQKEEANKKAKMLEEMDEQFGISDIIDEDSKKKTKANNKNYTANSLKGLKVEHDESAFQEGKEIILTLKDRNILKTDGGELDLDDDEEADVLVNVNIVDDEKAAKNVENKKKQTDYKPYDDFDDEGNVSICIKGSD
jgi:U4/U6.U5 tri-snRNP-associated protein 1